jgi:hypothetical protein
VVGQVAREMHEALAAHRNGTMKRNHSLVNLLQLL